MLSGEKMIPKFFKKTPSKIVAVGLNYRAHAKELGLETPKEPVLFIKPNTSLIGPQDYIILPKCSNRVDYEGELAVVIGKKAKDVEIKDVKNYVLGFTCLNDVTARDLQKEDGQWTRSKSFDTFCSVGPVIVKPNYIDPNNVYLITRLNKKIVQNSNTKDFVFDVWFLISYISKMMTLNEYDIITTGTPPGVGPMKHGDLIEVEIEGIGVLSNYVK
jgi:2-keto-4-pentenoate hydratase/2-oxohepta-3-ene-1,7-dioic acid hydratase in catechol pathway